MIHEYIVFLSLFLAQLGFGSFFCFIQDYLNYIASKLTSKRSSIACALHVWSELHHLHHHQLHHHQHHRHHHHHHQHLLNLLAMLLALNFTLFSHWAELLFIRGDVKNYKGGGGYPPYGQNLQSSIWRRP